MGRHREIAMRYLVVLIALLVAACTPDANAAARATRT
jgi:hypothetical protein